jgi:hypothetical protein
MVPKSLCKERAGSVDISGSNAGERLPDSKAALPDSSGFHKSRLEKLLRLAVRVIERADLHCDDPYIDDALELAEGAMRTALRRLREKS